MSLRAGRAGRVDATRACFGGAARSATPPRRRAQKSVVVGSPPEKKRRENDFDARRDKLSSQTEKTFIKMGAVDVLFGADGTPRCAWR